MAINGESGNLNMLVLVLLFISSVAMLFGSAYLVKNLAILYGFGLGAASQSIATNTTLSRNVSLLVSQVGTIQYGIEVTYILSIIALAVFASAFILLIRRHERITSTSDRYVVIHAVLTLVFALVLYMIIGQTTSFFDPYAPFMLVTYGGIVVCLICDVYLEYTARQPQLSKAARIKRTLAIDPSKPFSNIINLQENLFPNLSGHLRIIDKHFNSTALTNLHRLMENSIANFTKITILTSREMLDSSMTSDIPDFRSELSRNGIGLEIKLMDEHDTVDQHERMVLDDKTAYKVPPFNIINKRSEHITTINYREAIKRFNDLYARGIKLENYNIKQARDDNPDQPLAR